MDTDVVVVWGGLAGLACARALLAAGLEPVVLEARDRVGGRTLTEDVGTSHGTVRLDHGAQWVGPGQDRVLALAAELGLETFGTHVDGDHLDVRAGTPARYSGRLPTADPVVAADLVESVVTLTSLASEVDPAAPWAHPQARSLDGTTFATWIDAQPDWCEPAREWLRLFCRAVLAVEPGEVSVLQTLFYIRSAGGVEPRFGTVGAAQEQRFVAGAQALSLGTAGALGDRVRLGTVVTRIEHGQDGVTVHADGPAGPVAVDARRAVVAVPPPLAARLRYSPPLPGMRDQLTQRIAMGSVIKAHVVYPEPFWRDEGLSGQISSDRGPVRVVFDDSPPDGTPGVLLCFLEADDARAAAALDPAARRQAVIDCLVRYLGDRAAEPVLYREKSWMEEEFTRGCYVGVPAPGTWVSHGRWLRAPIGPIHWAGTETALVWNGYMDGAVASGQDAAAAIAHELREDAHA